MFDNGHLRDQPEESQKVMETLMMPMLGGSLHMDMQNRPRIVQVHDTIVERMAVVRQPPRTLSDLLPPFAHNKMCCSENTRRYEIPKPPLQASYLLTRV